MADELNTNEAEATTAATTTTAVAEKPKAKQKRKRKTKPVFAVEGKLMGSETPGFDVKSHAKLKLADFNDPLDFSKWEVWYYTERAKVAQADADALVALGSTPEERKAKQQDLALVNKLREALTRSGGDSRLTELLGNLFAEVSNK